MEGQLRDSDVNMAALGVRMPPSPGHEGTLAPGKEVSGGSHQRRKRTERGLTHYRKVQVNRMKLT